MSVLLLELVTSPWVYLILIALVCVDILVPIVPSGTFLVLASVYAVNGRNSVIFLFISAVLASLISELVCYLLVRRYGAAFLKRRLKRSILLWSEKAFADHSTVLVLISRFTPAGRTITAVTAATTGFPLARFFPLISVTSVLWGVYGVGLGYLNGLWFNTEWIGAIVAVSAATVMGIVIASAWRQRMRRSTKQDSIPDEGHSVRVAQ